MAHRLAAAGQRSVRRRPIRPDNLVAQTPFQNRAWAIAQTAHSRADRADARILMRMVEVVDEGDYGSLSQLCKALRPGYREQLGTIPESASEDAPGEGGAPALGDV